MEVLDVKWSDAPPRSHSSALRKPHSKGADPAPARAGLHWVAKASCASVLILCLAAGCVTEFQDRPTPLAFDFGATAIEEINLLAIPVALNLDLAPGVDGFVIKVFASNRKRPKPFPIVSGQIEVLMFDGIPRPLGEVLPQPLRTWQYSAEDLKQFQMESSIGTSYQLAPAWAENAPARNKISVVARYTSPDGATITSAPSIISVALK
jgi:hypothetical protein